MSEDQGRHSEEETKEEEAERREASDGGRATVAERRTELTEDTEDWTS